MTNRLFLDIETVPTPEAIAEAQRKIDEMKIQIDGEGETVQLIEDPLKNLSFSAITARIVCIGYAVNAESAETICLDDEAEMLKAFWEIARPSNLFVGHNILDFDLRFIWQRSVIHQIKPTWNIPFTRFRNSPVFDTMQEWGKWAFRGQVSLDALCRALGIASPKADGLDGSKVAEYYAAGRIEEISEYCRGDVEAVREVYRRLYAMG